MPRDYQPTRDDGKRLWLVVTKNPSRRGETWAVTQQDARERAERKGYEVEHVYPVLRHDTR